MIKKKSLGQNFLKNPKIAEDMAFFGETEKDDLVLEIGPGEGIMTNLLLQKGADVIAIEKDQRLIPILEEKFLKEINSNQLKILNSDALEFDFDKIPKKYKIIANIPYYITGHLIRKIFDGKNLPESVTLLIQKEVAERIIAKNGKESLLSISVKVYGNPNYVKTVKKGNFSPSPKVDSAIIHIDNISLKNFKNLDKNKFFEVIKCGFAHKRKILIGNLSEKFGRNKTSQIFSKLGMNIDSRAEDLKIEDWIRISKEI